jgi:diaminopimelate decarboxylase
MNPFWYKDKKLYCEEVSLEEIAGEVGTPFYVYSHGMLKGAFRSFTSAFAGIPHMVCFAVKSCSNIAILKLFVEEGGGADIVSGGELYRALQAGVDPRKVVYSGVGKRRDEIDFALETGILMFNVESLEELDMINACGKRLGKKAGIALRINPDVDPQTHHYIATGLKESKFGIAINQALEAYRYARTLDYLEVMGVSCHIGSQILSVTPFADAIGRLKNLLVQLQGEGFAIRYLDLGGGLGISYRDDETPPDFAEYARAVRALVEGLPCTLIFEPGRSLSGQAGALVSRVLYRKAAEEKNFIVIDAGMNDLIRPALYDAWHRIIPVSEKEGKKIAADIVGPVCESGDCFAHDREIEDVWQDDLLAVMSAGAYGFAMASLYNSRPKVPEILVCNDKFYTIRQRETYADLIRGEMIPILHIE